MYLKIALSHTNTGPMYVCKRKSKVTRPCLSLLLFTGLRK